MRMISFARHRLVFAPACLALIAMPAVADHAVEHVSEKDYFAELPVVLSVSRLAQPLNETPGAVTIIDAETIRRSGAREVAELLRLVPGFLVTRRNGGNMIAGYHSALDIYGARMQVYIDGRSVYSSYYLGDTHRALAAVDLADVQRIEILRGSNSAAFGANAFLGVINIITHAAADTHGVSVSLARGERGIDDNYLRIGWGNDAADLRLSASRRATSGFESLYDDSRRSQLQFRGDFHVSPADELSVKLGAATESFGEGVPRVACGIGIGWPGICDENKERTDFWRNAFARFDWTRILSETATVKVAGGIDQEFYLSSFVAEQVPFSPPYPLPIRITAPVDFGGKALRQNIEVQRTDIWGEHLRTVFAAEMLREEVRSPALYSSDAAVSASQLRVFGGVEWKPSANWIINTGGAWERHSMAGTVFAPRFAVNYHLLPEHTLRVVSTQSFRMPSLYMLRGLASLKMSATLLVPPFTTTPLGTLTYAAASGNVRPESVISSELGYLGELRHLGLKVDVRAFRERMNNRHWTQAQDYINLPGPDIHGVEYQLDWKPFPTTRIVFSEAQLREEAGRNRIDEHSEAPHRTGSLALFQKLPGGFDLTLLSHFATGYQWAGKDHQIDRMRQLDVRLAYAFRVGATRGELAATIQSFGGNLEEYLPNQVFGRRAFVSLRLDY